MRTGTKVHGRILALSEMDRNNDVLYNPLPVTLEYAKVLSG